MADKFKREHRMVPGYDFMPDGWCGACEHCDMMPCPRVCLGCPYSRRGYPKYDWPAYGCKKTLSQKPRVSKNPSLIHNGSRRR